MKDYLKLKWWQKARLLDGKTVEILEDEAKKLVREGVTYMITDDVIIWKSKNKNKWFLKLNKNPLWRG